jgi:lysophospholipase L1-like esterase
MVMGLVFLLTGFGRAQTPAAPGLLVKDGQKVVFMGDSITGMGWGDSGGYVHLVVSGLDTLGVKIVPFPAGVGGNRSVEMLARLDKDVLSVKPDWLLLSCGVNDVWSRTIDLDTFKKNITSIVDQAQAAGIKVMLLTPTPIYEDAQTEFSTKLDLDVAWIIQFAKERNLPLADLNAAYLDYIKSQPKGLNHYVTVDGVHPNPDGHQLMAKGVLQAFGAMPDQIDKVQAAWLAAPNNATITIWENLNNDAHITLRQFNALKKVAADRKISLQALINSVHMQALMEALKAHESDFSKVHDSDITNDTKPIFQKKIEALVGAPATPASL